MTRRNMHPEDVKAAVRKTGISLSSLGPRNGLAASTIRAAIVRPVPRGNRAIARYLGKTVHEIWPEWFDEAGDRVTDSPKDNPTRRSMASQTGKAA